MRLLQRVYRCAGQVYTSGGILKADIGTCPQRWSYHSSVTLFCPDDHDYGEASKRGRGAFDFGSNSRTGKAMSKQGTSGGSKAMPRRPFKMENRGKRNGSEPKPRFESRLSTELQRLSQDDFSDSENEEGGRAEVRLRTEMVFGAAPCLLALTQGRRALRQLFVKESSAPQRPVVKQACEEAGRRLVPVQHVGRKELDRLCSGRVHQGLVLEAGPLEYLTDDGTKEADHDSTRAPLWLVLDRVQDPMNLGAILRSAYFLGVDRILSFDAGGEQSQLRSNGDCGSVKGSQGWRVVGTVGASEVGGDIPVLHCSDFLLTTPTLLLIAASRRGVPQRLRGDRHSGALSAVIADSSASMTIAGCLFWTGSSLLSTVLSPDYNINYPSVHRGGPQLIQHVNARPRHGDWPNPGGSPPEQVAQGDVTLGEGYHQRH
ncbi:hypothetical protein JZ751_010785 [Albula glossodonta]|uniref:RNA 2-O ribose methyltransferase substrate binding domain-containing protein n=1 Tax=Albula glossodonta TaxID=121402 RepID=A0A8T2N0G4_9TELE|nr:hypothetical protein JZ751_010785 [Albula glossodonta]